MIGDFLLSIVYWFLASIIGLIPASTGFPSDVFTAASTIGGYAGILSPIIPLGTLATVVGLAFSAEIAIFGFKTLKWILAHIPFIGGKG